MTKLKKLLSVSSEALGEKPEAAPKWVNDYNLGWELFHMLELKNGFYAFEHALHVLPTASDVTGTMTLEEWNSTTLWRSAYDDLTKDLFFFAEDIFGDQFCLAADQKGILRFYAETAERTVMADSFEQWANVLLSNYEVETGWTLAHDWQLSNGQLQFGQRLQPKIPFVYGGEYALDNLWAGDAVKGMLFKAEVAMKVKGLPDGTRVRLEVKDDNPA
jgi:hypothetical protein